MKTDTKEKSDARWIWVAAGVFVVLGGLLLTLGGGPSVNHADAQAKHGAQADWQVSFARKLDAHAGKPGSAKSAGEIVAARLKKFAARRLRLVHDLAKKCKVAVNPKVEQFFQALDDGDFATAQRLFRELRDEADKPDPDLRKYWRAVLEAEGAAEQVQLWPAQQLLDYGNGILNSLKPGMVYFGGTDPGCFICTMLNETSDGTQHITLTQNALADPSYLDYLNAIHGGSLNIPTPDQLQNAIAQYAADFAQRQQHDQQFPDEPPQVLPGENVTTVNGVPSIGGKIAVFAIDNLMTQMLVQANPGLSFGMEESGSMPSVYAGSLPLGPIFQLQSGDAMTSEDAGQAVDYWQNEAQSLEEAGETSSAVLRSYAHDADAQGNLLANNNYLAEAGQAYQAALAMWPSSVEAITGLTSALARQGQLQQAGQALDSFLQNNPDQTQVVNGLRQGLQKSN